MLCLHVHGEEAQVDQAAEVNEEQDLHPWRVALLRDVCHLDTNGHVSIHKGEEQAR
jgi:hypothetical protein